MKKLVTVIALISIVALVIFSSVAAAATSTPTLGEDESSFERLSLLQEEAVEASQVLLGSFSRDENGNYNYPDNYAGEWIEGSTLYIALTDDSKESVDEYMKFLDGYDCIKFVKMQYSLNELQPIKKAASEYLRQDNNLILYYTDFKANRIVYEFDEPDLNKLNNVISEEIMSDTPFGLTKNVSIYSELFVIKSGEVARPEANIYGGMDIQRGSSSGPSRTIGMCGTVHSGSSSYDGVITAGHNLAVSGTNSNIYRNGSLFGTVAQLMWFDDANGDWATIEVTTNDTMTNKVYYTSSANYKSITGTVSDPTVGTFVRKYGQYSGYATGTVTERDVTKVDGSFDIHNITRCSLDSGSSAGGDSGGPYYIYTSSKYKYCGVHWGSGSTTILFSPYVTHSSYFTPKTN